MADTIRIIIKDNQETVTSTSQDVSVPVQVTVKDNQEQVKILVKDPGLPVGFNRFNGNVDVLDGAFVKEFTAGENINAGEICYLNADGKMYKADASSISTAESLIVACLTDVVADETSKFILWGVLVTSGLSVSIPYYLSTTSGGISTDDLNGQTDTVTRCLGYALTTTNFWFLPSQDFIVNL